MRKSASPAWKSSPPSSSPPDDNNAKRLVEGSSLPLQTNEQNTKKARSKRAAAPAVSFPTKQVTALPCEQKEALRHQQELVMCNIPWLCLAPFLTLSELVNCRGVCHEWHLQLRAALSSADCAALLSYLLSTRNAYFMTDTANWIHATQSDPDVLESYFHKSKACTETGAKTEMHGSGNNQDGVQQVQKPQQQGKAPLDQLLQCARVLHYLPQRGAVCFNPRYGRHMLPLVSLSDNEQEWIPQSDIGTCSIAIHRKACHRRATHNRYCPTCKIDIPKILGNHHLELNWLHRFDSDPSDDSHDEDQEQPAGEPVQSNESDSDQKPRSVETIADMPSNEGDIQNHCKNEPDDWTIGKAARNSRPKAEIDLILPYYRKKGERGRFRLDMYPNQCIPNLPSNLVCPMCKVDDRRTLVLSQMTYKTALGTEHLPHKAKLTFTPHADYKNLDRYQAFKTYRKRCVKDRAYNSNEEDEYNNDDSGDEEQDDNSGDEEQDDDSGDEEQDDDSGDEQQDFEDALPTLPFPPLFRENFHFVTHQNDTDQDVKHAISIHCCHCQQFGVFSPAERCHSVASNWKGPKQARQARMMVCYRPDQYPSANGPPSKPKPGFLTYQGCILVRRHVDCGKKTCLVCMESKTLFTS